MCVVVLWGGSICGPLVALSFVIFPILCRYTLMALVVNSVVTGRGMVFDNKARTARHKLAQCRFGEQLTMTSLFVTDAWRSCKR
uniref:Uncharacterized protein n=1 Tax=Arundo donax TaxID=35708 RepID=A0A0A9EIA3_ARUDO